MPVAPAPAPPGLQAFRQHCQLESGSCGPSEQGLYWRFASAHKCSTTTLFAQR
ncbi:uncharacterized protein ASCRUDRAFT_82855 [Ascoidea rubescens DSM 1968]|uniref:Uncharacterized protein n=1 Tax=Ascoidea rubescens DSM 1968 TaxID=1344418 RepID=A0A1D2V9C8_9ASCO|nr:hypothetical protein ASCRUDRAFT_82855 [Ascoidea rubescens DSM 1968]ODV58260.1 hypothetical protein ASCRUDRAFT_82855 [Ascoidea rubescens DSM 1968]